MRRDYSRVAQSANEQLSGEWLDNLTYCEGILFDGQNLIYSYEIDEDEMSFSDFEVILPTIEENVKTSWKNDSNLAGDRKNLQTLGGSVIYKYKGSDSYKTLTIKFRP